MYWGLFIFLLVVSSEHEKTFSSRADSTPVITDLIANNAKMQLLVKWTVNLDGKVESKLTFEIQTKLGKNITNVTTVHFDRNIGGGLLQWTWVSGSPLQCANHSVRIRSLIDPLPSSWSAWKTNSGVQAPENEPKIFPAEQVLEEGSSRQFCCIVARGKQVAEFSFKFQPHKHYYIDDGVYGITVNNLAITNEAGVNVKCSDSNSVTEEVNFVSFPPQKPRNISCETQNMMEVNCSWILGRRSNLSRQYSHKYTLILQKSHTCKNNYCTFHAIPGQKLYNITVKVTSPLGVESENHRFLITDIVSPKVEYLKVTAGTHHANVSFHVAGNFSGFNFSCQVGTIDGTLNWEETLTGLDNDSHKMTMHSLQPWRNYTIHVRCFIAGSARGFGPWSSSESFTTQTEPPSVILDLWKTVDQYNHTRNVLVMWKTNSSNSNVRILSYVVWYGALKPQVINWDTNQASITIGPDMCNISVKAVNEGGSSLPSYIVIPPIVNTSVTVPKAKKVKSHPVQGILLSWAPRPWVTCGYTVDWSKSTDRLDVNWVKVPVGSTTHSLSAEQFVPGWRYTFRVFGCMQYEHFLLEEYTGYGEEQSPKTKPELEPIIVSSSSVLLSWKFNEDDPGHPGFIIGYDVTVKMADSHQPVFQKRVNDSVTKNVTFDNLQDDTKYTFQVQARTAAGLGPPAESQWSHPSRIKFLAQTLTPPLMLLSIGILIAFYCKRIKVYVMPIFSTPVKLRTWKLEMSSSFYEVSEKIKALKVEDCPCSSIDELDDCSKEKLQVLEVETQSSHLLYCPQSLGSSLCTPMNSGMSDITNLTYFSTSEPSSNPYVIMPDVSHTGPLGYITTADKFH